MHYFLGLEVWQRTDEIFVSQEKYTMEILKMFSITKCKSMPTPIVMDLKKISDTDSGDVDPHLYRQLIGSLMYLVNTRPNTCCSEYALPVYEATKTYTLDSCKTRIEILTRHNWLWPEICSQCGLNLGRICQCRLGRKCSRKKDHFRLLFHLRINHGFLV